MNFLHSGSLGDVVYSLPAIKSIMKLRCPAFSKANLYLRPDVPDTIPAWAGKRQPVRMNRAEAERLLPLLSAQPGLGEVALFDGQPIDIDLDQFRASGFPFDRYHITRYYALAFRCAPVDYLPWLTVEPSQDYKGTVLVNRTQRYRNKISYRFLSGRPDVVFVGYPEEYSDFAKDCPGIPRAQAPDALTLARWIAGAKGFIGNQSFCFSIAEALKVPRLLEVYPQAPNVVPSGAKRWEAIRQDLFQESANELLAK